MGKCILLNAGKGIYTLEEICQLFRKNNINFKIVSKKARVASITHNKNTGLSIRKEVND